MPHPLRDVWVIYPSTHEPGKCVAHSLYTDQIGVGDSALDAYLELARALRVLIREAARDPRVRLFDPAPEHVWKMLEESRPLPKEIVEIARRILSRHRRPKLPARPVRKPRIALPPRELVLA